MPHDLQLDAAVENEVISDHLCIEGDAMEEKLVCPKCSSKQIHIQCHEYNLYEPIWDSLENKFYPGQRVSGIVEEENFVCEHCGHTWE